MKASAIKFYISKAKCLGLALYWNRAVSKLPCSTNSILLDKYLMKALQISAPHLAPFSNHNESTKRTAIKFKFNKKNLLQKWYI